MIIIILLIGMFIIVIVNVAIKIWLYNKQLQKRISSNEKQITESMQNILKEDNYEVHKTKSLTEEEIAGIHARGKITPAEKVKEWEDLGICAPGDYAGSAAWRCHKFKNCHDCLVDYANTQDEYTSFYDEIKIVCK